MNETPHLDPAASLALIQEQQERVRDTREPDGRLILTAWAVAWLAGYLALWTSSTRLPDVAWTMPSGGAFTVFGVLLTAAVVLTIVHTARRSAGTRGPTSRAGTLYGWSFAVGFLMLSLVMGGLASAGASDEVLSLAVNALSAAVVGLLYLGGGIAFREPSLYALGVWMVAVAGGATLAGLPASNLVMALAGGGGFLVLAVVEHVVLTRRRRATALPGGGS